mmetsp:Transcript_54893/g.160199  ORF Transcript_54893/g.160199 Transcript_54893/m.160199 type:complete len:221 (+) Transcript_54893:1621-2283(+)
MTCINLTEDSGSPHSPAPVSRVTKVSAIRRKLEPIRKNMHARMAKTMVSESSQGTCVARDLSFPGNLWIQGPSWRRGSMHRQTMCAAAQRPAHAAIVKAIHMKMSASGGLIRGGCLPPSVSCPMGSGHACERRSEAHWFTWRVAISVTLPRRSPLNTAAMASSYSPTIANALLASATAWTSSGDGTADFVLLRTFNDVRPTSKLRAKSVSSRERKLGATH